MIDLRLGDCRDVLKTLADASVDSVVTDPPYELGFMGKAWDGSGIAYDVGMWRELLRVLKPGGHLLAFGGSRTYHRLACAIEDAGFEIRDQIMWLYGSGFPKSLDVGKAIDKRRWQGWGTALKPAHEPIVVARKPLIGTVAENVLAFGTGAINVDGCRVDTERCTVRTITRTQERSIYGNYAHDVKCPHCNGSGREPCAPKARCHVCEPIVGGSDAGRWPANVIHDGSDEVLAGFPETTSGGGVKTKNGPYLSARTWNVSETPGQNKISEPDTGSAARFFYTPKADATDRDQGLEGAMAQNNMRVNAPRENEAAKFATARGNHHPTVKPTELMRYLCRLVTPPGGIVLDPFMGSGSTGKAAALERFDFIGIEREAEYLEIARARIAWLGVVPSVDGAVVAPAPVTATGAQLALSFA